MELWHKKVAALQKKEDVVVLSGWLYIYFLLDFSRHQQGISKPERSLKMVLPFKYKGATEKERERTTGPSRSTPEEMVHPGRSCQQNDHHPDRPRGEGYQ